MRALILLFLFLFSSSSFAQSEDSLLHMAKEFAYAGSYQKSIDLLLEIETVEAKTLLTRVYAWSHQYERSLELSHRIILNFPEVVNIYQIAATTALWGGKWSVCYQYINLGLQMGGDTIELNILKIKALVLQKRWLEADQTCLLMMKTYPENATFKQLNTEIQKKLFQKELIIRHTQDYFTLDSSQWKNSSIILKNKTKYGPLLLSANHSNRFNLTGIQGEVEFYPKLDSNYYAYIDLGVSGSELFPNFRNGISLFRALPKAFEVELGYRNLFFKEAGNVWFYLGSVTKYFGNNNLTYRFTSIHSPEGSSATHGLKLTHYLDDQLSSVSLELGSGTNARDYQTYSSFKPFSNINSKRIQIDYKQFVHHRIAISFTGAYEEAPYRENQQGKRLTFGMGLNLKF